ncbi:MAG TPA: alpha/beta hydrolase [Vicinamibacteria bacterium]|nr:alpha/beta hydrolase [Vicinamibacteria bacterium]
MKARAAANALLRILALLAAVAALMLLFERRLIYFPQRGLDVTPQALGLVSEELPLRAEDGVRLHGWFLPVKGSRLTLLVCHGNGGNVSHRLDRALAAQAQLRTDVLLFDYRGYGRSEGSPDEEGTYRDARAAWRWLIEKGQPPGRIVIFGESLGSAVALQLALDTGGARALVLESPFASIPEMARAVYPFLPVWPLVRTRYDNLAKVGRLRLPLLVMHGERDDVVPFAQGRRLFEAAPEPKRFYAIPGASHNDTYLVGGDAYWRALRDFLDSPTSAASAPPSG